MPETVDPIIELKDVVVAFGDNLGLRNVSLSLHPGQTHVFFGAAGSGKTTLLKSVIGLVKAASGDIKLFGVDVTGTKEHDFYPLRSRTGVLFQEGGLFDSLEVGENVEYPLVNQQAGESAGNQGEIESRVREALRFVELEHTFDKFPSELSGGMRRRVGIARAIVTNPQLVLYDSPTAGLDPITANTIMALIAKQRDAQNTASLLVTHRYQDGEIMADFRYDLEKQELIRLPPEERGSTNTNFIVMKQGEIVFSGSREELEANTDEYVKRFVRHEG
ncbi:MAG TPA: ATP-binding cassette domain-containing protein [Bryobacteraceae bacterium]|jgi:phospholipid/cholesterol/gamma-HCH transport system ATP-binding protein|nr:ATP-binding cassette domain-containing protein [Bryobacteraceae bacterium]